MKNSQLDLKALREITPFYLTPESKNGSQFIDTPELKLSRRSLLSMAGAAVLAAPALPRTAGVMLSGGVRFRQHNGKAEFALGTGQRWSIDPACFAGKTKFNVKRSDNKILMHLTGARYPNTRILAGFYCEIKREVFGWRITLQHEFSDFKATASLERWLAGAETLQANVNLPAQKIADGDVSVNLKGSCLVEFTPDGNLRISGPAVASVQHAGETYSADIVTLHAIPAKAAGLITPAPEKPRTLVRIERGEQSWQICPERAFSLQAGMNFPENSFDTLDIEYATGATGRPVQTAYFKSQKPATGVTFTGTQALATAVLPLQSVRCAMLHTPGHTEAAVFASLPTEPVLFETAGTGLLLTNPVNAPTLEAVVHNNILQSFSFAPAILTAATPLTDGIHVTLRPTSSAKLHFVADTPRVAQLPRIKITKPDIEIIKPDLEEEVKDAVDGIRDAIKINPGAVDDVRDAVKINPGALDRVINPELSDAEAILAPGSLKSLRESTLTIDKLKPILRLDDFTVSVLRPEDLLCLNFNFFNFLLITSEGAPVLRRAEDGKPAYVVVEFPPQHIGEEAVPEEAPELSGMVSGNTGSEVPDRVMQTRLAGPSRLAFRLGASEKEIPFTMDSLLTWSKMALSVAPAALPPPPLATIELPRAIKALPERNDTKTLSRSMRALDVLRPNLQLSKQRVPQLSTGLRIGMDLRPDLKPITILPQVIEEPKAWQTSIEAPYRLMLSPHYFAAWLHSLNPVVHDNRTELWHTRMAIQAAGGRIHDHQYVYRITDGQAKVERILPAGDDSAYYRTLRAIWSPDYSPTLQAHVDTPFIMSLDGRDRCELVTLTADFKLADAMTRVVNANNLMLSALGAWLDVDYAAPKPLGTDLEVEGWRHQAPMGRDQFVKVIYKGYLFPFGHAASLIKETERKFVKGPGGYRAILRQRFYIIVRSPEKNFTAFGQPNDGRSLPFRKITLKTLKTPTLDRPDSENIIPKVSESPQAAFRPQIGGVDFVFHVITQDWLGNENEFVTPLAFIGASVSHYIDKMNTAINWYRNQAPVSYYKSDFAGQKTAVADTSDASLDSTTLEVLTMSFGAEIPNPYAASQRISFEEQDQPLFYPTMRQAEVRLPAATKLAGTDAARVALASQYVEKAWDATANKGQVFLSVVNEAGEAAGLKFGFPSEVSGGLVAPDTSITGLSRSIGTVSGDLADYASGVFNPESFFKDSMAQIFGCIDLWEIISGVFGGLKAPNLTTDTGYDALGLPESLTVKYDWQPSLQNMGSLFQANNKGKSAEMKLHAAFTTPLRPGVSAASDVDTILTNFTIGLSVIELSFNKIRFHSVNGGKPDVDVDINETKFIGPLKFVDELSSLMKTTDMGGFSLDLQPTSISAGFSIQLPTLSVGIMSIQNMSLGASIKLSYVSDPVLFRFNFCSRENPFIITVSLFGGGGFFAFEIIPSGMKLMEASLEFGGNFALNLGVASGSAWLMAGIYFKYENDDITLTGYLRCGGRLSVLGIITVSAEFYLGFTYESAGNRLWGQAKLTVEIEILFFSFSVTLTVERTFAGSSSSSANNSLNGVYIAANEGLNGLGTGSIATRTYKVVDLMSANDWQEYCQAFA